ncbi:fibronectin type III domain-containing protein [Paenibacillus radicis (ex Xue et al. 2023)]|uniref:Probable pectate lyase C n=1 Tax=Paenibacillus radicis (ex Xue et al. 2023) TaxID=2972489 RepID=A0ABT1YGA2_9BACL|nr:fibronectin type III domain-containing protein [Paenibacillus radicis (ex Xue et al. 2023)]MCR8632216.1 fibronectin type III domain-containing protein [Paenibacillus radicis (ex Xue et al. 2023)]
MNGKRLLSMVVTFALVLNLLLSGIPLFVPAVQAADEYVITDIINDDYESMTGRTDLEANGYVITPNPGTPTNDIAVINASGIANPTVNNDKTGKVLQVKDAVTTGDTKFVRKLPSSATGLVTVDFDWRVEKTALDSHGYKVMRVENQAGNALIELRLSDNGTNLSQYLYSAKSNKKVIAGYQKDVWYQVKLEIDTNAKKAQAYARAGSSGAYVTAGQFELSETEANSAAEVSQLSGFTTTEQTSNMYYDNIKVSTKIVRPAAPTGLTAVAGDAKVNLSWTAINGMSYTVKRSNTNGGPYTSVQSGITTGSYVDNGLNNGTTYYFVVSASSNGLESTDSSQATATPLKPQPPAKPTGLTAAAQNSQVILNWNAAAGAQSYTVKYATTSGGPYISVTGIASNSHTVTGLTNNTTYYFTVSAVNEVGPSGDVTEVQAKPVQSPPPLPPTGVKATASDAKVNVSWSAVNGATSYNVKRSTDGQNFTAVATGVTATNYTNTGLTNGTTYYYVVTAVNIDGESVNSAAVSVAPVPLDAFSPTLSKNGGWFETAYVEWAPVSNAQGYNVYVKPVSASDSQYVQIDTQLIRRYAAYWRADATGLAAGDYVMKVEAVLPDGSRASAVSDILSVAKHDRSGFAFSASSPFKTGSGAYNNDGTLKSGAQVLYVTSATAKTVTLDVITSSKGAVTKGVGIGEILKLRQKGYDKTPLAFRFIGKVTASDMSGQLNSSGYLEVKGKSNYDEMNVTLEGIGDDAYAYGWGFLVRYAGNVEIRNLGVMLFPDDGISLDTGNVNVWLHNNDIFYGTAGGDADQAKGDGSTDLKGASTYITISYNHYWDSGKSSLVGLSESSEFFVTFHHNWFDHSDSRHPRVRTGTIHVYNNFYDGIAKYGVGATTGSSIFVESNYFRNAKNPMMISLQGTDIKDGVANGTFSGETGGMIKAYNNIIVDPGNLIYANSNTGTAPANATSFDAYLASSRNEAVPSSYLTLKGGTAYNNFDTLVDTGVNAANIDAVSNVEQMVTAKAGRLNKGDFTWEFNNSIDDASYSINAALMNKIKAYTAQLLSVGGNSTEPTPTLTPSAPGSVIASAGDAKVTLSWAASSGATSYTVKRSTSQNGTFSTIASNVTLTSYVDSGLTNGSAYFYVVTAVNANGESLPSGQVSATPAVPVGNTPSVSLPSVQPVAFGTTFNTKYGLSNVSSAIFAQDITFQYDSDKLEFVSAESLKAGLSIVQVKQDTPGQVRLIVASLGQTAAVSTDELLIQLNWKAKTLTQSATATITALNVKLAGSSGDITQASAASVYVQLANGVNLTALQAAITNAETYHSSAVEGTNIGQYPQGSKAALQAAIDSAKAVLSNETSTQQQVEGAAATLNAALESFKEKVIKTIPGDLNGDQIVNVGDLAILAAAYGLTSGQEGWNDIKHLDFNNDGVINIVDLVHLANLIP